MTTIPRTRRFQRVGDHVLDRTDCVWLERGTTTRTWKCVLCGGVVTKAPPFYPTDPDWLPERFETLTDAERQLCPFPKV